MCDAGPHCYISEAVGEYYRKVDDNYVLETTYEGHDVYALLRKTPEGFRWTVTVDHTEKGSGKSLRAYTAVSDIDDILRILLP